jgi:hypothetical protein
LFQGHSKHRYGTSERHTSPFLYYPGMLLPDLFGDLNKTIEVRIEAKYLTNYNEKVIARELWGDDIYTDDSDMVASKELLKMKKYTIE